MAGKVLSCLGRNDIPHIPDYCGSKWVFGAGAGIRLLRQTQDDKFVRK